MIDDLILLYGDDLDCSLFKVRNPTISDIIEYGKSNNIKDMHTIYETGIQMFTAHPYDYMVMLDDMKIDFEKISKFELFKILYTYQVASEKNEAFLDDFFDFMFNDKYKFRLYEENNDLVIVDTEKNIEITEDIHNEIFNLFSLLHGLNDRSNDILFGQEILKKLYIKKARKRLLKKAKNNRPHQGFLSSKIMPILKLYGGAITKNDVFNLNMFTMTELLATGIQKDHFDNVMFGIYSGNVDSKTVDKKTLNWYITE